MGPSVPSSPKTRWSILFPSPEVKVPPVLSRDSVSTDSQESPIEVSERSLVSVPGIHLLSSGQSLELVTLVTITELRSTRRSTESLRESSEVSRTTPPPSKTHTRRTSPQSVDSHITVSSTRITCSSRVPSWVQERDKSPSERVCIHQPTPSPPSQSRSNSSILLPRSVTVNSRPSTRRTSSWVPSLPRPRKPSEFD